MADKQNVKFGDICREVKLTTKDPIADGYERYIGLEHLDSGSLKIKRWGIIAEDNPSFSRVFKKGHILFGKRRPYLKKAAIAEFDGICSGDIIVMEPTSKLTSPELLSFIVQSEKFWSHAINTSSGSLSPRTKFKELSKFQIELFSESNQVILAESLSHTQKTVDLNESFKDSLSNLMNSLIDSIIFKAQLKAGFWGGIPRGFKEVTLQEITLESAFGPRYPSDMYDRDGNIGTIRTTDFDEDANINYQTVPMAKLDERKFKQHFLEAGDLLITRSGTCGLVAVHEMTDKKIIPGAFIIRFRLKKGINSNYIKLFLMLPKVQHYIEQLASGGVQKNLTSKNLLKIPIIYPENEDLVEQILDVEKQFSLLRLKANEKSIQLKSIQESLINKMS